MSTKFSSQQQDLAVRLDLDSLEVSKLRRDFPVLVIDDDLIYRELIRAYLHKKGFVVKLAASVDEAEDALIDSHFRLILCDWLMPIRDGLELCRQLRRTESLYHYLILMTSQQQLEQRLMGLDSGADDYVCKSAHLREIVARLDCGVRVLQAQRLLETQQKQLLFQVQHDALTGIYNRAYLFETLPKAIATAQRYKSCLSVILCDVDHFKAINDQYGHLAGDQVLKAVANRMFQYLRSPDMVARYGGEEFVVVLPHTALNEAMLVAEKLRIQIASMPIAITQTEQCAVTASFGVAEIQPTESIESMLKRADTMMYQSKRDGRNRCSG